MEFRTVLPIRFEHAAAVFSRAVALARNSRRVRKFSFKKLFRLLAISCAVSFVGMVVGATSVIFPPMISVAIVAIFGLMLIWTAPEARRVPTDLLRKALFVFIAADLFIPNYYAVQLPGFPWISVRRAALFCLVGLFLYSFSGSRRVRDQIYEKLDANRNVFVCFAGFYVMCVLSLFTSYNFSSSFSQLTEVSLDWYIPALACMIAFKNSDDLDGLVKLIAFSSLFVSALGWADFVAEKSHAFELLPASWADAMIAANPTLARIGIAETRNGVYRAKSIFTGPLSFGEFTAVVAPFGAYFMIYSRNLRERLLGVVFVLASVVSLYTSGARGGAVAFLVAMSAFAGLVITRHLRENPRSMVAPFLGLTTASAALVLAVGIFVSPRIHNAILGGGETAGSDQSRFDQAAMAWPHIFANPLTGYGLGNGAQVIGYTSPGGGLTIDSSILTLLVETGVPGFCFFAGMLFFAIFATTQLYFKGRDRQSAIGAAFSCSLLAYAVDRLVLAQLDNQALLFVLFGAACVLTSSIEMVAEKSN